HLDSHSTASPSFLPSVPSSPALYTLSLHDALPICIFRHHRGRAYRQVCCMHSGQSSSGNNSAGNREHRVRRNDFAYAIERNGGQDRKSTRLNSSHGSISYAVCCLKKKK